jgi:hypothetical protein
MQTAKQIPLDFQLSSMEEASQYLNWENNNSFYCLGTIDQEKKWKQRMLPMATLPFILNEQTPDNIHNTYISQASFIGFKNENGTTFSKRLKTTLAAISTLFVDFDYHKDERYKHLCTQGMTDLVIKKCIAEKIPLPSLIVDSGCGIQAKWLHCQLPRMALPRWEACEQYLIKILTDLAPDNGVREPNRCLRLVNTPNLKSGRIANVCWLNKIDNDIKKYEFNELCEAILPYTQEEIKDFKKHKKKHKTLTTKQEASIKHFHSINGFTTRSLNWSRLNDLEKLRMLRNLDMGDGLREPMSFWQANFYALTHQKQHADPKQYLEILNIVKTAHPGLSHNRAIEKASRFHNMMKRAANGELKEHTDGKKYTPLYTPTNERLIEDFGITSDEIKCLSTIIDSNEKNSRKSKREKDERYNSPESIKRRKNKELVLTLAKQGLSQRKIGVKTGLSRGSVVNYLKVDQKPRP